MSKKLFIAEKPSVAREFARVLGVRGDNKDGYIESSDTVVTWCVGHLITMSYPEAYDPALKRWSMETLPFIPSEYRYEVIDSVKKQYTIVSKLLTRSDVEVIYVCTDSGREGEYIYRLVSSMAGVSGKIQKRVWIDSQTEEEILRGIKEAKDLSDYDDLADAAYLRAREDYLMGINFSRVLTLKFGDVLRSTLRADRQVLSVGRVMTCVLGMVVRREREIRQFTEMPFYRLIAHAGLGSATIDLEWKAVEGSRYYGSPLLYKDNGFKERKNAEMLADELRSREPRTLRVLKLDKKNERKKPPLLFNLAELQNECSRRFKISPDQTLQNVQELYEKKLVTYPRTDARVLSSAVAKEIDKNIKGLMRMPAVAGFASEIIEKKSYISVGKSQYTDDKKITDHYALIPTGQGLNALNSVTQLQKNIYEVICRRFLSIFYPPAIYEKIGLEAETENEHFFANLKVLKDEGYLKVSGRESDSDNSGDTALFNALSSLKKGDMLNISDYDVREGKTQPPKRYNSGSLILAMENAGQLIEDEELREQIKGSGIGTSATRAEILKKLNTIRYLRTNPKTQIVSPELGGELVFDIVEASMKQMLNPELTASWEKGLTGVADGTISKEEYMSKLSAFVTRRVDTVKGIRNPEAIRMRFSAVLPFYSDPGKGSHGTGRK